MLVHLPPSLYTGFVDFFTKEPQLEFVPILKDMSQNTLFYGNDPFLVRCAMASLLRSQGYTLDTEQKVIQDDLVIMHNTNYIVIDCSISPFPLINKYIKHVVSNRHVLDNARHILIIENIQCVSKSNQCVLNQLFERYSANATFVLNTRQLASVSVALQSRFALVRVGNTSKPTTTAVVNAYCDMSGIDHPPKTMFQACGYDVELCMIALSYPEHWDTLVPNNMAHAVIKTTLKKIRATKYLGTALTSIRSSIYLLMKYNLSISTICRMIFEVISEKHAKAPDLLHAMARHISRIEHRTLRSSKPLYHLETLFLYYLKHV